MKKFFLIILMMFLTTIVYAQKEEKEKLKILKEFTPVSLIQLIATPQLYEGKNVLIIGYVNLEFEGDAVYLSEGDCKHGIFKNGLWININEEIKKNLNKFNHHYCLIVGVADLVHKGHMNAFSGSIKDISHIELME